MPLIKDPAEIITVTFDFAAYDVTINNPVVSCDVVSGKVDASAAAMLSGAPQVSGATVLQRVVGVALTHVPYKTSPLTDVVEGRVTMFFANPATAAPLLAADRLRALAVVAPERLADGEVALVTQTTRLELLRQTAQTLQAQEGALTVDGALLAQAVRKKTERYSGLAQRLGE